MVPSWLTHVQPRRAAHPRLHAAIPVEFDLQNDGRPRVHPRPAEM